MNDRDWNSPLFQNIEPEDGRGLLKCLNAREVTVDKHAFLLGDEGEAARIGVVLEGSVQMICEDPEGKRSLLAILSAGSVFGESYSCLRTQRRTIAYQANEKSRILLLDYARILHSCKLVCRFHHRMIENMVELIAAKNLELIEKIEILSCTSIREKLLTYLGRQAERAGCRTFTVPMGRTALAEYLCADRSAMTRELARMQAEGLLTYEKRVFTLRKD